MNDEKRVNIVILGFNPYLATIFVSKMSSAFSSAAYIQVHFRFDFFNGSK